MHKCQDEKAEDYPNLIEFIDSSLKKFKYFFSSSLALFQDKFDKKLSEADSKISEKLDKKEFKDHISDQKKNFQDLQRSIDLISSNLKNLQLSLHENFRVIENDYVKNSEFIEIIRSSNNVVDKVDARVSDIGRKADIEVNQLHRICKDLESSLEVINQKNIQVLHHLHDNILGDMKEMSLKVNHASDMAAATCDKMNKILFIHDKKIEHFYILLERAGIYKLPGGIS